MRFAGQVAIVTGGSRGIGRATALALGTEGAQVWIGFKQNEVAAQEVAAAVTAAGGQGVPVRIDLESAESIGAAFDRLRAEAGALDLLVANAAATAFKPLMESKAHNLDRTFQITVKGFLQLCQEGAPLMAGRQGKIVAVSGYDSIRYIPGHGTLGAAKAAMEAMVRYLAVELAPEGINVNGVCPGPVATDSARLYAGPLWAEIESRVSAATPRRRIGTAEDVAKIIAFLCSDAADWLCGQTLVCDGGLTLNGGAALFGR
ncbi:MAG TPA: SDR family oxidoreductase [Symbiobacteriaceae bacterium]|nr:SDR family oxidoreductase [Symbiobacteriaceae bacterium]